MTDRISTDELRKLLAEATPGEWNKDNDGVYVFGEDGTFAIPDTEADAALILAVRDLAAEITRLRERLEQAERERDEWAEKAMMTPSADNATSVAEDHDPISFDEIGNYYGTLSLSRTDGQDYWSIENWDGPDWKPIPDYVGNALRALAEQKGE